MNGFNLQMHYSRSAIAAIVFFAVAGIPFTAANAQEVVGTLDEMSEDSRYQLKQKDDVFVRLDKKTGTMSVCRLSGDNLVCRMAADDREALVEELDGLQERIARLENENTRQPRNLQNRERQRERHRDWHDYPLEEEIDEAVEYSGRVIRKFFDVMKELREDMNR